MGFIDHIQACNNHDLSKFVSFQDPDGTQIGWVKRDNIIHLKPYGDAFSISDEYVRLKPCDDLTDVMGVITKALHEKGLLTGWRDELYAVTRRWGDEPLFEMERTATPFFGIRAFGVHINGFVRDEEGLKIWIGKRADDRAICPGMWDNMVAGGQPANLTLAENIIKECVEEANVPADLAVKTKPVGSVSYVMETDGGIKPDVMFCYDLEVPKDFTPENTDGEVASFHLMKVEEVAEIVRTTSDFKFNCNLVVIDFLIRHGILNPDDTPDYEELVRGLRC